MNRRRSRDRDGQLQDHRRCCELGARGNRRQGPQLCWTSSAPGAIAGWTIGTAASSRTRPAAGKVLSSAVPARGLVRTPAGSSPPLQLEDRGDIAGGPGPGDTFGRAQMRAPMSLSPGAKLYQDQDGRLQDDRSCYKPDDRGNIFDVTVDNGVKAGQVFCRLSPIRPIRSGTSLTGQVIP